jgi:hypothetical protein
LKKHPRGVKGIEGDLFENLPQPLFFKEGIGITGNSLSRYF